MEWKICKECGQEKPVETGFFKQGLYADGRQKYMVYCRECSYEKRKQYPYRTNPEVQARYKAKNRERNRLRQAERRAANPDAFAQAEADRHLKRKYGLTREQWNQMLEGQEHTCPICMNALHPDSQKICVDHCHQTGAVRGLLHDTCNKGIGALGDDPANAFRAWLYLTKENTTT